MIRILLVDDQNLMLQGIKALLEDEPNFQIVGVANNGRTAVEEAERLQPDIVSLDLEMPKMNGITATEYIRCLVPQSKVIILTCHDREKYIVKALQAGAKGYLLKDSLAKELQQTIWAVSKGYSQIESKLLAKVVANHDVSDRSTPQKLQPVVDRQQPRSENEIRERQQAIAKTNIVDTIYNYLANLFKISSFTNKRSRLAVNKAFLKSIWKTFTSNGKIMLTHTRRSSFKYTSVLSAIEWFKKSWLGKIMLFAFGIIIFLIVF